MAVSPLLVSGQFVDHRSISFLRTRIQPWDGQRAIIPDHLNELIEFQREQITTKGKPMFYGVLILCQLDGVLYIVDGQHRFRCAEYLCDNHLVNDVEFEAIHL